MVAVLVGRVVGADHQRQIVFGREGDFVVRLEISRREVVLGERRGWILELGRLFFRL